MQEPSGLLAPFLRVFLPLFIGKVRLAAPQRPRGLWLSHARGAQPRLPAPLPSLLLTLSLTEMTAKHAANWLLLTKEEGSPQPPGMGGVAPLVERFEATPP